MGASEEVDGDLDRDGGLVLGGQLFGAQQGITQLVKRIGDAADGVGVGQVRRLLEESTGRLFIGDKDVKGGRCLTIR